MTSQSRGRDPLRGRKAGVGRYLRLDAVDRLNSLQQVSLRRPLDQVLAEHAEATRRMQGDVGHVRDPLRTTTIATPTATSAMPPTAAQPKRSLKSSHASTAVSGGTR
jgi:hypothetical protein